MEDRGGGVGRDVAGREAGAAGGENHIEVAGVFIATLIVVSIITVRISDMILDSRIGALDRTLGFLFGLARGL